jgi:hypothetical protein
VELDLRAAAARRAGRRVAPEQLHFGSSDVIWWDTRDVARREPVKRAVGSDEVAAARDFEAGLGEANVELNDVVARGWDSRCGRARVGRVVRRGVGKVKRVRVVAEEERLVRPVRECWRADHPQRYALVGREETHSQPGIRSHSCRESPRSRQRRCG